MALRGARRALAMGVIGGGAGVTPYQALQTTTFGTRLLAYWPLTPTTWAEGDGGVQDVSGNTRHATNNGATPNAANGPGTTMETAPVFDATNDYIDVFSASLDAAFNPKSFTLVMWTKSSDATFRMAMNFRQAAAEMFYVYRAGVSYQNDTLTGTPDNEWTCVVYERTPTAHTLYFDNVLQQTKAHNISASTIDLAIARIGLRADAVGYCWNGYIAHVMLIDGTITPTERAVASTPI